MRQAIVVIGLLVAAACSPRDTEPRPDDVLRRHLGLTDADRVHTVSLRGGEEEQADPALDSVAVGTYVQFVTTDWFVHEVAFDLDSIRSDARAFLERTDQIASPPLLHLDARYLVSFAEAPPGRYPYRLEGNGRPGRGAIVVVEPVTR